MKGVIESLENKLGIILQKIEDLNQRIAEAKALDNAIESLEDLQGSMRG